MGTVDTIVIILNLIGALAAVALNLWASERGFLVSHVLMRITAVVAGMYAIGYAMLLADVVEFPQWSSFFRGVSVAVWPIVWSGHAILALRMQTRLEQEVKAGLERDVRTRN